MANDAKAPHSKKIKSKKNFKEWYGKHAKERNLDPNPDAPEHYYDYRAAFLKGQGPDKSGHWPSEHKREGHPRKVINGVDTKTGKKVKK